MISRQHVIVKSRLHQGNVLLGRATCCRIQATCFLYLATCCLYLGKIITIHLCHGRLVSFVSSNRRATNWQQLCCQLLPITTNMLTATGHMLNATCCLGVNAAFVCDVLVYRIAQKFTPPELHSVSVKS